MVILSFYQKRKIIANFSIDFSQINNDLIVEEFDLNKFLRTEYENCIVLLDEVYTYLESRISGSELNRAMSYILFQSRKKNIELYITAQLLKSIDVRFRELSDCYIIANRKGLDFNYTFIIEKIQFEVTFNYQKVEKFFSFYNTNEVIKTTNQKVLFDIQDSDDKLDDIQKYAEEIKDYYNKQNIEKVTKSLIDLYIATHDNIPKFLSANIFAIISLERKLEKVENNKKSNTKNPTKLKITKNKK